MSETLRTAPAPETPQPSDSTVESNIDQAQPASIDQSAAELEAALSSEPERVPDTSEEAGAREAGQLASEQIKNEAEVAAGWRIRTANRMSRAKKSALLLNTRELKNEKRMSKLDEEYKNAKPGSRKAMRLDEKMARMQYRQKKVTSKQEAILGNMHHRSYGFAEEKRKLDIIEGNRNDKLVLGKLAIERKRRRKIKNDYERASQSGNKHANPRLAKRLAEEMKTWEGKDGNTLMKFYAKLDQEMEEKYRKRIVESSRI